MAVMTPTNWAIHFRRTSGASVLTLLAISCTLSNVSPSLRSMAVSGAVLSTVPA